MTVITVRLLGEPESRSFEGIDVDNKIEYTDLKKRIAIVTQIPPDFQEIRFRGEKLPVVEYPIQDIKFGEELVVAHSELPWWNKYKESVDIAMKPGRERISNARDAVKLHKRLMENGFFDVYSSFDSFRRQYHHMIASWTDGSPALMKEAARNHFRAKHFQLGADDEKDFVCRLEARSEDLGGSRKNTLVFVQLHNERKETKYNLKCHHYGSSSGSAKRQSPDIKELYGYKLLELIEVGPHVEFVLPNELTGSTTSMYIATKWNGSFTPVSRMGEEDASAEVLVQILLLGTVLQVNDLHADNCGMWGDTKEVAIVDFRPRPNVLYPDVVKAFLHNISYMYWETLHIELLEHCDEATRLAMSGEMGFVVKSRSGLSANCTCEE